jgi:dihydrofolate reductase
MRQVTVLEHVSLDGVMQAPGRADEDPRDGFDRGGWAARYADEVLGRTMGESMAGGPGELLFGRRTYEDLVGWWLAQTGDNPFTGVIRAAVKHVVTTRPDRPLPHPNSAAVTPADLAALKADGDVPLTVMGSGRVVAALREENLVDRYVLIVNPLLLGRGRRLFPDGPPADLRLVAGVPTTTGAIIATYEVAR